MSYSYSEVSRGPAGRGSESHTVNVPLSAVEEKKLQIRADIEQAQKVLARRLLGEKAINENVQSKAKEHELSETLEAAEEKYNTTISASNVSVAVKDDPATSTNPIGCINLNTVIIVICLVAAGLLAMQVLPSSLSKIADDKQLKTSQLYSSDAVESLKHEVVQLKLINNALLSKAETHESEKAELQQALQQMRVNRTALQTKVEEMETTACSSDAKSLNHEEIRLKATANVSKRLGVAVVGVPTAGS